MNALFLKINQTSISLRLSKIKIRCSIDNGMLPNEFWLSWEPLICPITCPQTFAEESLHQDREMVNLFLK